MPDWTLESLRIHLSERIDALTREVIHRDAVTRQEALERHQLLMQIMDERQESSIRQFDRYVSDTKTAINKSEESNATRFESMNEFRGQLKDQTGTFMTRAEYNAAHAALTGQISGLSERVTRAEGRGLGLQSGWAYLLGAAALLGVVVASIAAFK